MFLALFVVGVAAATLAGLFWNISWLFWVGFVLLAWATLMDLATEGNFPWVQIITLIVVKSQVASWLTAIAIACAVATGGGYLIGLVLNLLGAGYLLAKIRGSRNTQPPSMGG